MKFLKVLRFIIPIVLVVIIFINSFQSEVATQGLSQKIARFIYRYTQRIDLKTLNYLIRKAAHFAEFFLLGFFSFFVFKHFTYFIILGAGIVDEFIQIFINGRNASIIDVIIDGVGGVSGVIAAIIIIEMFNLKKENITI